MMMKGRKSSKSTLQVIKRKALHGGMLYETFPILYVYIAGSSLKFPQIFGSIAQISANRILAATNAFFKEKHVLLDDIWNILTKCVMKVRKVFLTVKFSSE